MGKTKQRRIKSRQACPTGVPSIRELEQCEELEPQLEIGDIDTIIEKLKRPDPDSKECAAFTIANMTDNAEFVTSLIEKEVIRICAPLLLDSNLSVKHAIAGCLRNMSASGGHLVSQAMVEQDVMTALVSLMQQYKEPWPHNKTTEGKIDSKAEIFTEACNLLWSLCESSNTAVSIFNEHKICSILLQYLNVEKFGPQIPLAVAQCLHTVTEDNTEVTDILSQPEVMEQLQTLMSLEPIESEYILLKTLASGIVLNIQSGRLDNCLSAITTAIMGTVVYTLSIPISPELEMAAEQINSHKSEKNNKNREDGVLEQRLVAMNETFKKLDNILPAKQISLEILTNICFGDDSNDWDDMSSSDTSEETCMDIDDISSTAFKLVERVPHEVSSIIVREKLLEKVLQQIVTPTKDIAMTLIENSRGKKCLKRLASARCRALFCLSNMVQNLDFEDLGGGSVLFDLWLNLGNLVFKETDVSDTEQLEASTSSMRAVLQKLAETDCSSQFSKMTNEDLALMVDIYVKSQESAVKVNIIRSIGTIGCLLANSQQNCPLKIVNIGTFLLEVTSKCSEMWVVAEALDVIFDVFAEDNMDSIACEINLVEKLSHLVPQLKGKIKQQKKSLGEHLPIIMTAKTNLLRFIKYKNERINK